MSISLRQPMGWIALSALTVLILAGTGSTGAPVDTSLLPRAPWHPGARTPTGPAHRHHPRGIPLPARDHRRPDVRGNLRRLRRFPGRAAQLLPGQRHCRIRRLPRSLRRHDPQRRRGARVRDLRALPAAQSRAHRPGHETAGDRAGLDAGRDLRIRSRESAAGRRLPRSSTNCGASGSRATACRCCWPARPGQRPRTS